LSPALHRAAYAELGLTGWRYDRYDVGEDELAGFVESRDASWRGLSLTMPLKVMALALGEADAVAVEVQAANTLIFDAGRRRVYNTDVEGLVSALRRSGVEEAARAVILGSGATARSAVASARDVGVRSVTVVARNAEKAQSVAALAWRLGLEAELRPWGEALPAADLLISTVTAGAVPSDGSAAGAAALADCAPVIFDAVYDPWPTALATAAAKAGHVVINGLDLLVGQAVAQILLMTGKEVAAEVLYRAGRAALSARADAAGAPTPA
jgi:shikimate dehydrogenase